MHFKIKKSDNSVRSKVLQAIPGFPITADYLKTTYSLRSSVRLLLLSGERLLYCHYSGRGGGVGWVMRDEKYNNESGKHRFKYRIKLYPL